MKTKNKSTTPSHPPPRIHSTACYTDCVIVEYNEQRVPGNLCLNFREKKLSNGITKYFQTNLSTDGDDDYDPESMKDWG